MDCATRYAARRFNGLALIPCLFLLCGSIAPAADETWTPQHVAKIRGVTAAEISPDGKLVAYVLAVPRNPAKDEDGPAWTELHIVDREGKSRPFITGDVGVADLQWTADGKSLSFLAKRGKDKTRSLYVIAIDGGEARRILTHDADISSYSWNPDGTRVAFIAKDEPSKKQKDLKEKGFKAEVYEEDWEKSYVWIASPFDENDKPRKLDLPGAPSELHWGPVAARIALTLSPTPLVDDVMMRSKLYVYDADSGALISSFQNPGKIGDVTWSPDGENLAILSAEDLNDPSAGRLMIASLADGLLKQPIPNYEGDFHSIVWQDKDTIMYLADEGVWSTLGEVSRSGDNRKTHLPLGKMTLGRLSLSADGQCGALVSGSPTHPAEVFSMCHGDGSMKRLTHSNPWLDKLPLAKQEVVEWKARDGQRLEGILVRPLDEKPGTRYPLILCVHGGPEAHDRMEWQTNYGDPGQLAAARGFAVFHPNYRGSTGRGVAFSKMGQADYAGKEFDDLVDAVDHLIAMGLVDKDKVGITGGSYGGFATAWASTYYSDRFAAGVMFVGLSNLVSKYGTTDIPNEMYLVHGRKKLWDDWQWFLDRSPIYHAQKSKTPLLIMHGKDDPRVDPGQSMELYRQLKLLNQAPVRLVFYPGEGHGNRKAAARMDYNLRMMQWFEHYLKGPGGTPPDIELDYGLDEKKDEAAKDETKKDESKKDEK